MAAVADLAIPAALLQAQHAAATELAAFPLRQGVLVRHVGIRPEHFPVQLRERLDHFVVRQHAGEIGQQRRVGVDRMQQADHGLVGQVQRAVVAVGE